MTLYAAAMGFLLLGFGYAVLRLGIALLVAVAVIFEAIRELARREV